MTRKRMVFYGSVQGVGFRYHASTAANMYRCTGWVRNEYDGSVTMEIQGDEAAIDQVVLALRRGIYIEIDHVDVETLPVREDESSFRVRML